jgi:hypothetical protein
MISAILSFFGGSVFRMIWGEVSSWMTARQDHAHEIERMEAQGKLDAAQHARNLEAIRLQSELGVKEITVKADAMLDQTDADLFRAGVELTGKSSGVSWVDAWNGSIRPLLATICIGLWVLHVHRAGWVLDEQGWSIVGAALGIFVADRALLKRGK